MAWLLLVVGILAAVYGWQNRQPLTTSDFTLFYRSAADPPSRMYARPPGIPRGNMNPPHFQLLLRPLTVFSLPVASGVFRVVSITSLCVCLWWLASKEHWGVAEWGVLLAWAPMATVLNLNQVTWVLWPLLLWTWWCWRQERWTAGAVTFGVALSMKPFLGVLLLWLLISRRPKPAAVALGAAALASAIGLAFYGVDVFLAWLAALKDVQWFRLVMNASWQGWLVRLYFPVRSQVGPLPVVMTMLVLAGQAAIIAVTLLRTRRWSIDDSWTPLMAAALLASPLGWVYYIWWVLPGSRPLRLFFQAPMLWMPLAYFNFGFTGRFAAATLGSMYFWGLLSLWMNSLRAAPHSIAPEDRKVEGLA